jgi:hypothetical protein
MRLSEPAEFFRHELGSLDELLITGIQVPLHQSQFRQTQFSV